MKYFAFASDQLARVRGLPLRTIGTADHGSDAGVKEGVAQACPWRKAVRAGWLSPRGGNHCRGVRHDRARLAQSERYRPKHRQTKTPTAALRSVGNSQRT